jgi:ATP-dependent DNA helicase RecG
VTFCLDDHTRPGVTDEPACHDAGSTTPSVARPHRSVSESDLAILVQQGEGTTLEYKENLSDSLARELVALANTRGGKILLGVRDDGIVTGVIVSNSLRARVQDMARNCDPTVIVEIEQVGRVLVVHVQESEIKPVQCREGFFSRQGAVSQKLSHTEIRDFFRRQGGLRFDSCLHPRFNYPEDFDLDKFEAWRALSGISPAAAVEDVLVNMDVAERENGKLLVRNAGVLFFAKAPRRFFNQAFITCILFRGTERVHIINRRDLDGGMVADIKGALRFIKRNTRTAYRIESLVRQNIPEYPRRALREAIANALMHRDWFIDGANVFVEIHADRIDIVSPGGLPPGLPEQLFGRKSVRRNPIIADLLQRIGFIERAGTGISRMRDELVAHGSPEPAFEANAFFTATFRPLRTKEFECLNDGPGVVGHEVGHEVGHKVGHEVGHKVGHEAGHKAGHEVGHEMGHEMGHEARHDSGRVTAEPIDEPLSDAEISILKACREIAAARDHLMRAGGFAARSGNFRRALSRLMTRGLIEMTHPETPRCRQQRYRITEKGRITVEGQRAR